MEGEHRPRHWIVVLIIILIFLFFSIYFCISEEAPNAYPTSITDNDPPRISYIVRTQFAQNQDQPNHLTDDQ